MILEAFEISSKFRKVQKVRKRSTVPTERWKKTATIWGMNFDTDKHTKKIAKLIGIETHTNLHNILIHVLIHFTLYRVC